MGDYSFKGTFKTPGHSRGAPPLDIEGDGKIILYEDCLDAQGSTRKKSVTVGILLGLAACTILSFAFRPNAIAYVIFAGLVGYWFKTHRAPREVTHELPWRRIESITVENRLATIIIRDPGGALFFEADEDQLGELAAEIIAAQRG